MEKTKAEQVRPRGAVPPVSDTSSNVIPMDPYREETARISDLTEKPLLRQPLLILTRVPFSKSKPPDDPAASDEDVTNAEKQAASNPAEHDDANANLQSEYVTQSNSISGGQESNAPDSLAAPNSNDAKNTAFIAEGTKC